MKKYFLTVTVLLLAGGVLWGNELKNPGFEAGLEGWEIYFKNPDCKIVPNGGRNGGKALVMSRKKGSPYCGIRQTIVYDKPSKLPLLFSGWSKAEGVVGEVDYDILLDLWFEDNSNAWAIKSFWGSGTFDWRHTFNCYRPPKPVKKVQFYVLFRNDVTGKVWFDDMSFTRGEPDVQIGQLSMESIAPFSENGLFIQARFFRKVDYRCELKDAAGNILSSIRKQGNEIRWIAESEKVPAVLDVYVSCAGKSAKYSYPVKRSTKKIANPVKGRWQIWSADSMSNITPLTYPAANAPRDMALSLAKAESESIQLQITSGAKALKEVDLTLPLLKNEKGETFKGKIKWERVGYIPRRRPYHYHPNGYSRDAFWLPDPLLPARKFQIPANATQGIWLTVTADRNAAAGIYRGDVQVHINGRTEKVPLQVKVYDFALPETFSLRSAFCIMDNWLFRAYPAREKNALRREGWDIMLDHRLNPDDITRTEEPRIEDLLYARSRGMNQFNIFNLVPKPKDDPLWVCYSPVSDYNDELMEEFKRRLDPYVAQLRKHGLMKYAYVYGFDERWDEFYPAMNRVRKMLHERYGDLPFMSTARIYQSLKKNPQRTDCLAADWFCPGTGNYVDSLSAKLRKMGHQVWWYVCCGPKYPYANFASVEYPFIEGRLLAWQTWQHKADGFLYWHVNAWTNECYFDEASCYQSAFKLNLIDEMPGDGQLLYPGANGPLPSIRLANVRDGSEDYDYLALYGKESRKMCRELSPVMTVFTRDPAKLRELRNRIAETLEKRK